MEVERDVVSLGAFEFECGRSIPELEVAYEAYGEFTGDNAVLVCHALTGSAHVAGLRRDDVDASDQARAWWDDFVGPGKAIDTREYYVVCANVPGSCYGTTGPASVNPETGERYATDFPAVTVTDWTEAQRQLLDEMGIPHLHAVVGGSVGGMNVLEWAKRHPDHVERIVPIAAAARLDTQCLALDAIARRAITTDDDWQGGEYYGPVASDAADDAGDGSDGGDVNDDSGGSVESDAGESSDATGTHPDDGLALARQIGHVMYLSKASMDQKFGRRAAGRDAARSFPTDPAAGFFPYRDVESYLDYQAVNFVDRFDANSYLYLTRAMDNYDLSAGFESDEDALAAFDGEALVMSFTADWHFTTAQAEELADALRDADVQTAHHVVDSDHGHDAFLVEPESVGPPLSDFLAEGVDGGAVTDTDQPPDDEEGRSFAPVHTSLFSD